MDYRIVELRPDVFSVEEYKSGGFWIFKYEEWRPIMGYTVPSVPEYSPRGMVEFTRVDADKFIAERRAIRETIRLRANPPPGFPRVVDK